MFKVEIPEATNGMDNYPTDEILKWLEEYDIFQNGWKTYIETIEFLWDELSYGCYRKGYKKMILAETTTYLVLTLITGGWSGCEDAIGAINSNPFVVTMAYESWERGGLHKYRFSFDFKNPREERKSCSK